ncbi:MAG: neutral zinc metallopeptidase, partial [Flavobacterium sp.]|nr:neutral zinc metallopeptidase [Flavobacterium sp.]
MKWQGRRKSDNVEDRRGLSGGQIAVGGGVIGIIVLLLNLFGGENAKMLTPVIEQMQQGQQSAPAEQVELTPEQKELGDFASTV